MIRIISGMHKGRRLQAPRNLPVRPTTDRAKEALFNILAPRLPWADARVLDLFSGTGNISYECASRGCPEITAVDADSGCVAFIRKTAEALEMPIRPVRAEVSAYLGQDGLPFDFVFADPPYEQSPEELAGLVSAIQGGEWLAADGVLVVEHASQADLSSLPGFTQARKYGGTTFSFFEREGLART